MTGLKEIVIEQGRSQAWIAKQLGVSRFTVNNWVQGRNNISTQHLMPLARLLGVTTDRLLSNGGSGNHGP